MSDSKQPPATGGLKQFVSAIAPLSQQVGDHILQALQTEGTVAVVTTIVPGMPTDRVVSMPLGHAQLAGVQAMLAAYQAKPPTADEADEDPCIGFHCRLPDEEE